MEQRKTPGDLPVDHRPGSIVVVNAKLSLDHLVPGALVTVSPNKRTGTRSLSFCIWRVLATNGCHVAVEVETVTTAEVFLKKGHRTLLVFSEYDWYEAEHLADALAKTD